jgi:hypothetical protein
MFRSLRHPECFSLTSPFSTLDSKIKTSHRLLESPQAFLDRIVEFSETPSEPEAPVYWLCHDAVDDKLTASPAPTIDAAIDEKKDHLYVLQLSLRPERIHAKGQQTANEPMSSTDPFSRLSTVNSNVGTRLLWDDKWIHIWEFRIDPGERCPFHTHTLEYCFTNLSKSVTQALSESGEPMDGEFPKEQVAGQTIYLDRRSLGSHAVWNVGSTTFLQFIVEFKF